MTGFARAVSFLMVVGVLNVPAIRAQQHEPKVTVPELLAREREVEMALGAAPTHLRDGAGVYVLEKNGFVKVREARNGFTCAVNRDHPLALKPTCWSEEGTRTILPKVLRVGELLMRGRTLQEIDHDIAEGFRTGRFRQPSRPGLAYMLSGDIRNVSLDGRVSSFPPHVMIYAPNLSNADIGVTPELLKQYPTMPFIAYSGPHGYLVMVTDPVHLRGLLGKPEAQR